MAAPNRLPDHGPGTANRFEPLLVRVCEQVSETLGFARVSITGYDGERRANLPVAAIGRRVAGPTLAVPLTSGTRRLGVLTASGRDPFVLDAEEHRLLATFADLTAALLDEVRLAEELRRLDDLKSRFIAIASHELRTPVAVVYGVVETLFEHEDVMRPDQRAALVRGMMDSVRRLRSLVEQLLDLTRVETTLDIAPQPVPVRARVEELLRRLAPGRTADVAVRIRPDLRASVDPFVLERVLSTLVSNAFAYGRPPVVVSARIRGENFRLTVEDRGRGVPPSFVESLFEPFARSETAWREGSSGAGLALAIARSYAQAHGGDLVYEPAAPHGARFTLTVPQTA